MGGGGGKRYPTTGWLEGNIDDLADAIEHMGLSERRLTQGTERLERTVDETAGRLAATASEPILAEVARVLHQEPCKQTWRMAGAILTSAFVFHAAIDGQPGIPRIQRLLLPNKLTKSELLTVWAKILEINYWPIFSIARDVASLLPSRGFGDLIRPVRRGVEPLAEIGATTYHDLCGRMFQTMIADRKFLATFYTLPPAACLLAELAVERLSVDWTDAEAVGNLQVGDFACGTGALLSATQRAIYRRFRRAGGDDADLHRRMMEHSLVGLDIMPAAAHLTCSMLSAAHPGIAYGSSRIQTMPYGAEDGAVHIGSLDLLQKGRSQGLFDMAPERQTSTGIEKDGRGVEALDGTFDLVIMNPPFTRSTNHEGGHSDIPNPSFAGFSKSADEQRLMGTQIKRAHTIAGDGHAGLASYFIDLAHVKLKPAGVMALVLPIACVSGAGWRKVRSLLQDAYRDITVIAIATTGNENRAFSADTGMGECLLIATKGVGDSLPRTRSLTERPPNVFAANLAAKAQSDCDTLRGWQTAGVLSATLARVGQSLLMLEQHGESVRDVTGVKVGQSLSMGGIHLPRQGVIPDIATTRLKNVARRGIVHRDINGPPTDPAKTGPPQGPFRVREIQSGEVPEYPALWAHNARQERRFVVSPDRSAIPLEGDAVRAKERWKKTASRLHSNLDFQLNSQALAMCLTENRSIGGTAWPNVIPHNPLHELPLLLWANTTLGLISFWWAGTRQQQGRARLTITKLPDLPVLDTRTLTDDQIELCEVVFEELKDRDFLPANEAYRDEARQALDRHMLVDVLGMDEGLLEPLDTLRLQWCAEPSVHGGKGTKPNLEG